MAALLITADARTMPALDLIYARIGLRATWTAGPDRLEIDQRPSEGLDLDQTVMIHLNVDNLEELAGWADERGRPEAERLIELFQLFDDNRVAQDAVGGW